MNCKYLESPFPVFTIINCKAYHCPCATCTFFHSKRLRSALLNRNHKEFQGIQQPIHTIYRTDYAMLQFKFIQCITTTCLYEGGSSCNAIYLSKDFQFFWTLSNKEIYWHESTIVNKFPALNIRYSQNNPETNLLDTKK